VSVLLDMKMNSNRARLIVEFKEVQRLPDWPIIKLFEADRALENTDQQKVSLPPACRKDVFPAQGFAE